MWSGAYDCDGIWGALPVGLNVEEDGLFVVSFGLLVCRMV